MKMKYTILLALAVSTVLFTQCKKEKNEDPAPSNPASPSGTSNPTTIAEMFSQNGVQFVGGQASMASSQSMTLGTIGMELPGSAFVTSTGAPVTGMVDVSVKGIFTKKDIILSGAPANSTGKLVATKGCVKVSASQNSQTLRINPNANVYINVPEPGMNPASNLKKFYAGQMSVSDPSKVWTPAADTNSIPVALDTMNNKYYYHVKLDSAAWLNTGYEWDTLAPTTIVSAMLDSSFTSTNTAVYISLNGKMVVGAMYPQGNGYFTISGIPIGQNVYFVAISTKGGSYHFAYQSATITSNHFVSLNPQSTTLTNIQNMLLLLP